MDEHYRIQVRIRGIRPLLQNAFVQESADTAKKGKTYDDLDEAQKRLIRDSEGNIAQPALQIEGSLIKAAAEFKFQGRKTYKDIFKAGVFVDPPYVPHINTEWVIDKQRVVVNRAGILRCRPRFDSWELDFNILVREERIQPRVIQDILHHAGRFQGIGDYRPRYGLFQIERFEVEGQ